MTGKPNGSSPIDVAALPEGRRSSLLEGVRVLDLTRFLAGPFAGMVLADLGASVLKVEQLTGDTTRGIPPHYFEGDSAYFLSINRNKRSIALDIRTPRGQQVLARLVRESDIVLDNLRAPQRESLGISWEQLQKINPQIVSCSVTGFGSDGPYEDRPAYAIIVEAMAGVMSLTGPEGGPSVRAGVPVGDITAGIFAAVGALAGLEHRRSTGVGRHIDVSMLDSQISLLSYLAQYYLTAGYVAQHQGRAHVSNPTYNTFTAGDGQEVVTATNTQDMWRSLCQVLGIPELIDDPRFVTRAERLKHKDELLPILEDRIARWKGADLYQALVAVEVPAAPINSIDEALNDPQVRHREMVVKVRHRDGQDFPTLGRPIKDSGEPGLAFTSPPALGADTRSVLTAIGYSADEIAELAAADVVRVGTTPTTG